MDKTSNISTRLQMLKISFECNEIDQTRDLIRNWSIRDLYDLMGHAEIANIISMDEGKLPVEQIELLLEVLNEKGNAQKEAIASLIQRLGEMLEDEEKNADEIKCHVKLINKLKNELPKIALKEIADQSSDWRRYFKYNWPALRKKYLGK